MTFLPAEPIQRLDHVEHNGRTGQVIGESFFNKQYLDVWFGPKVQDHTIIHRDQLTKVTSS